MWNGLAAARMYLSLFSPSMRVASAYSLSSAALGSSQTVAHSASGRLSASSPPMRIALVWRIISWRSLAATCSMVRPADQPVAGERSGGLPRSLTPRKSSFSSAEVKGVPVSIPWREA